jgi:hypothetical protein
MPIIPATPESEMGRSEVGGQLGEQIKALSQLKDPILTQN